MFSEPLLIASSALLAVAMITAAALKGWQGWLSLKAREIDHLRPAPDVGNPSGMARIEIADLKERIRKLEAIAAGVDL
jgi:hypothetical protein